MQRSRAKAHASFGGSEYITLKERRDLPEQTGSIGSGGTSCEGAGRERIAAAQQSRLPAASADRTLHRDFRLLTAEDGRQDLIREPQPAPRHAPQQQLHGGIGFLLRQAQTAPGLLFALDYANHHNSPSVVRRQQTPPAGQK
jgi:hypothetical protein